MSKKDFIALADALRGRYIPDDVLQALIWFCRERNPHFNEQRWLDYLAGKCGPNGGAVKPERRSA